MSDEGVTTVVTISCDEVEDPSWQSNLFDQLSKAQGSEAAVFGRLTGSMECWCVCEGGPITFSTTVQPAASAGATFQVAISNG